MKKKKSAKKTVAKKSQAKKPAAKKAPAKSAAAKPSKPSSGTYTPQPVTGIGWAPFRYPLS